MEIPRGVKLVTNAICKIKLPQIIRRGPPEGPKYCYFYVLFVFQGGLTKLQKVVGPFPPAIQEVTHSEKYRGFDGVPGKHSECHDNVQASILYKHTQGNMLQAACVEALL